MADADLSAAGLRALVPPEARTAFAGGDEWRALTLLRRTRDMQPPGSVGWAALERLGGLLLIHLLREVEGTFALERADPVLDGWPGTRPTLAWLEGPEGEGPGEGDPDR